MLLLQGLQFMFKLLQTFGRVGQGTLSWCFRGHDLGFRGSGCRIQRLNARILRWGGSLAAHADRWGIAA